MRAPLRRGPFFAVTDRAGVRLMGMTENPATNTRFATFGGVCFWQVEEQFRRLDGVIDTAVGYEGGELENPTYEQVCRGDTGHVEVARIEFDPEKIDYADLVQKYF